MASQVKDESSGRHYYQLPSVLRRQVDALAWVVGRDQLYLTLLITPGLLPAQTASPKSLQVAPKEERKIDEVVIDWLKRNAIPIKSVEAGKGFDDLHPFKRILVDARVVGLGEATHGSREFFQFKHRMVEFLVQEMNFNVFAIETSYARCLKVNDYVAGGKTSRAEAMQNLEFSLLHTEEVAALVDWLRAYNQTAPPERKVKFFGFDLDMDVIRVARPVLDYIHRVAPEKTQEVRETINKVLTATPNSSKGLPHEIDKLIRYFVLQEANFTDKTSRVEYEENLNRLRLLFQIEDVFRQGRNDNIRDRYMAENILYLLTRERPGTRIAVWAHNGHVSTGNITWQPGGGKAMGAYLRQKLAKEYYALGLTFNEGSFQTIADISTVDNPYAEYTVGPAGKGSLNWYFAQPKIGNYMIDFRNTPKDKAVWRWLTTPRGFGDWGGHMIPENYQEIWAAGNFIKSTLSKDYDGMISIERTTRARPLSK